MTTCRSRHRTMIATPADWPCYPFLPLARSRDGGGLDLGVMVDARLFQLAPAPWVFRCNLILMPLGRDELLSLPTERYESIDHLLAAGWRVD